MTMPDELYSLVWDRINGEMKKARYAKVIMKLEDVLTGDFFTDYVKKGRVHLRCDVRLLREVE